MPHISPYNPGLGHDLRNQYSTGDWRKRFGLEPSGYNRPSNMWGTVPGAANTNPSWLRAIYNPNYNNPLSRYLNPTTFSGAIEGGPQFSFPMPWLDQSQIASDRAAISNVIPAAANITMGPSAWKTALTPATTMAAPPNIWDAPPASNSASAYVPDPLQWHTGQPYAPPATPMVVPQPSPVDMGILPVSTEELMQRSRNTGIQGNIPPEIRAAMGPSAFSGRGGMSTEAIMASGGGPRVTDRYNRRIQNQMTSPNPSAYLSRIMQGRGGL